MVLQLTLSSLFVIGLTILSCSVVSPSRGKELVAGQEKHGTCPEDSPFRTAVRVDKPLPFCSEFAEKTCCDADSAKGIRETVYDLIR
jgi:hypothetical protein